jgi:sporulation protein YlmC with PRC-barrel domain
MSKISCFSETTFLTKRILDIEGFDVEVVYDIQLLLVEKKLFIVAADVGRHALMRRIGLGRVAKSVLENHSKEDIIPWRYVQPLGADLTSTKGDVKLKVLKETLSNIHPVDLADIIEDLDHNQRLALFGELDTERASDTLEEIDPHVQRDLVSSLGKDKVVLLLNQMTPAQAADILSVLPSSSHSQFSS